MRTCEEEEEREYVGERTCISAPPPAALDAEPLPRIEAEIVPERERAGSSYSERVVRYGSASRCASSTHAPPTSSSSVEEMRQVA